MERYATAPSEDPVVRALVRHGGVDGYRAALPMPKNVQEVIDSAVVRVARDRLVLFSALQAAGLGVPLPNWLATLTLTSHKLGEAGAARRAMVPSRGERGIMQWTPYTIPIYLTWDQFGFNSRELAAAQQAGQPLDSIHAEQSTRNVNVGFEDALINGAVTVDGLTTPGLLSTTTTETFETGTKWDDAGKTGEEILADTQTGMRALQVNGNFMGPYLVATSKDYGIKLGSDFKANGDRTIRERLLAVDEVSQVVVADYFPDDTVVIMQLSRDVVDIQIGQMPAAVSVNPDQAGWATDFYIIGCAVPRVKSDANNKFGICKMTPT